MVFSLEMVCFCFLLWYPAGLLRRRLVKKIFCSLPLQLLGAIVAAFLLNMVVCDQTVRFFFTASYLIKELLEFFLPAVVFFFVAGGISSFAKNSLAMILLLLVMVTISNGLTGIYTYFFGLVAVQALPGGQAGAFAVQSHDLAPFYSLNLPGLVTSDKTMLAALFVGLLLAFISIPWADRGIALGKSIIEKGLRIFFIPVLPLYVFGFFLKMVRELPIAQLVGAYGMIFLLSVLLQVVWLAFAYVVVNLGSLKQAFAAWVTAVPSYLTALGTMSSVATLPVSMVCAGQNTKNPAISHFAMPILANIHLMGDAVCTPLFALATMKLFFGVLPSFTTYLVFVGYLCLTMLAVSGIPGGGIIVMLPLLKSLFGFTPEMLSVMTALYLLQDGFGTAANVMGDGALVIAFNRISSLFKKKESADGRARRE